ncbi:MAG: hydroxyacylglutathione hydrolase [Rhizobiales bacterium]|nr:hydroxyacylglutathione hydrolase [Hyphomicrobiales bacterium]
MAKLEIHQFPCLSDNYGVLIHDPDSGATASIDAPEQAPIEAALAETGWQLSHILVTHHHADHTQANLPLKQKYGVTIVGNRADASRIPGIDIEVDDGGTYDFAGHVAQVMDTSGHTVGHITYYFADDGVAFAGDTLFALGCGRVFEGTMAQMWASLAKLKALPAETVVYCGHEYTQANAKFSLTVDPDNAALVARAGEIDALRARGEPTVPTTIGRELETNPFMRPDDPAIRALLGMADASDADVFAEIRRRKDSF